MWGFSGLLQSSMHFPVQFRCSLQRNVYCIYLYILHVFVFLYTQLNIINIHIYIYIYTYDI